MLALGKIATLSSKFNDTSRLGLVLMSIHIFAWFRVLQRSLSAQSMIATKCFHQCVPFKLAQ
jgi:hypothetical protein